MHWQGMREKYSYVCKFLFDLGLSFLPNSQIIQVESSACFWQPLSSALKPSVMGSRRTKTWRERGGIEHLSEGKKDILIKLVDLSAQEFSFPIWRQVSVSQGALRYPACFSRGARKNGLSKMMAWGVRWTNDQAKPCIGIPPRSLNASKQESQDPSNLWVGPSLSFRARPLHTAVSQATSVL